jgi:TDG/mug DNA glycosylase family protein
MAQAHGFPPIAAPDARVLVLGSMPGLASLRLRQYYGHPHNAFWKIMAEVLGLDAALGYPQRTAALKSRQVAVWDVLATCRREGSLDTAIEPGSVVPNDFAAFMADHPAITRICFNGSAAERLFRRHVLPGLTLDNAVELLRLPSTSPAHAGMPYAEKLRAWQVVRPGPARTDQETPSCASDQDPTSSMPRTTW